MSAVLGMADLLLGTDLTDEQRAMLETLQSSAEALLSRIGDIFDDPGTGPPASRPRARHVPPTAEELLAHVSLAVLLAEDDESNQRVGQMMLGRLGHDVDVVSDGHRALDAAQQRDYDVILMDMHMPTMDGLEATRRIRAELSGQRAQPTIVAMTASVTVEDREACVAAGMDGYLTKPVRLEDLERVLTSIEPHNRRPGAVAQPTPHLRIGAATEGLPRD